VVISDFLHCDDMFCNKKIMALMSDGDTGCLLLKGLLPARIFKLIAQLQVVCLHFF
jgi:hypothetical protein